MIGECGANLEDLIGMPLSPATLGLTEAMVTNALNHDGFLTGELREVVAVAINQQEILIVPSIQYGEVAITPTYTFDLREGLL